MDFLQSVFGGRVKYFFLAILIFVVGACGVSVGLDAWTEGATPPEQVVGEALMYAVEAPRTAIPVKPAGFWMARRR